MAITKPKGLKFPKIDYKKKINGRTDFTSTTENFTLEATPQWNGLHGIQLDHLPARAADAIGQTIADPVVVIDGDPILVRFKSPDGSSPVSGECYIDLYSGTIQFNADCAGLPGSVTYYVRADLVDHNAMNRIWQAGHTFIVSDETWADFDSLQDAFDACQDGDSVKLLKDITTTGLTLSKKIKLEGNNRKIIKSGSATGARAIIFSEDLIVRDLKFEGWDESGDICLYADADVRAIISSNDAIGNTELTNASVVCTNCIVENNLPFSENVGQATTIITNNVVDKNVLQFIASTSVSVGNAIFLDLTDRTKCKDLKTYPVGNPPSVKDEDIFLGIALNNASIGGVVDVAKMGLVTGLTGLTAGKKYYVSNYGYILTPDTLPYKPLTNIYPDYTYNPLAGTSGQSYHTEVGRALTSTSMIVDAKRMNNLTKINCGVDGLALGDTFSINQGGSKTFNIFSNSASPSGDDFNTSHPWQIEIDFDIRANALSASTFLPSMSFELWQNVLSGYASPQKVDAVSVGWFSSPVTDHHTKTIVLTNLNPGIGRAKLIVSLGTGGGVTSGNVSYRITKVKLKFL